MSSLFGNAGSGSANAQSAQGDISKDVEVKQPPEDSISDLSFSWQSEHLAVSSWDKKVRIYEIDGQGNSTGKAFFEHEGPVLSCTWSNVSLALHSACPIMSLRQAAKTTNAVSEAGRH